MRQTAVVARYVRFQSPEADHRGRYVGVFGLVNSAAKQGVLPPEQEHFRRTNNAWYDATYTNPTTVDPAVYDPGTNPFAAAWFKSTASELIARVDGYLDLCSALGIVCQRVESDNPGKIIYEDAVQIVVVPMTSDRSLTPTERQSGRSRAQ